MGVVETKVYAALYHPDVTDAQALKAAHDEHHAQFPGMDNCVAHVARTGDEAHALLVTQGAVDGIRARYVLAVQSGRSILVVHTGEVEMNA